MSAARSLDGLLVIGSAFLPALNFFDPSYGFCARMLRIG